MHPALGGMQLQDSSRTQTLRFKAVTMRTASQHLSGPGPRSVNTTLSCGKELQLLRVRCFSPCADPRFSGVLNPLPCRALLEWDWYIGGSWCFLWKQPLLSFLTRSVVNTPGLHPFLPLCLGSAQASGPPTPHLRHGAVCVDSSKLLLLQKKEQLGKHLHRRGGVRSSSCSWLSIGYFMGTTNSCWSMAWNPGHPSPQVSIPFPTPSFTISWGRWMFTRVQKWMDGKANLLNVLNTKTPLRNCLSQRLLAVERVFRGNTALCFPVPVLFPKQLFPFGHCRRQNTRLDGLSASKQNIFIKIYL